LLPLPLLLPLLLRLLPLLLRLPLLLLCLCPGMPPDANAGRIWVESSDSGRWRLLLRSQQLDQLKQVLEPRGAREGGLHAALLRVEGTVRAAMPGRPFQMPPLIGTSMAVQASRAAGSHTAGGGKP
jgi:hypothetical protein